MGVSSWLYKTVRFFSLFAVSLQMAYGTHRIRVYRLFNDRIVFYLCEEVFRVGRDVVNYISPTAPAWMCLPPYRLQPYSFGFFLHPFLFYFTAPNRVGSHFVFLLKRISLYCTFYAALISTDQTPRKKLHHLSLPGMFLAMEALSFGFSQKS